MKTCPGCGKGIGENTNYCPFCGTQCVSDPKADTSETNGSQDQSWQTENTGSANTSGPAYDGAVKSNNGLNIAGMVLGIVAIIFLFIPGVSFLGWICGIVGIILSAIAISNAKKAGQKPAGMAVAGLVLSIISIAIGLILVMIGCVAGCAIASTIGYSMM